MILILSKTDEMPCGPWIVTQNLHGSNHNKKKFKNFIKSCLLSYHNWMIQFKIKNNLDNLPCVLEHFTIMLLLDVKSHVLKI